MAQSNTIITLEVTEKEAVELNEYNGTYELVSRYGVYQNWAKYRIGKDSFSETPRPVKVVLGNKEKAEQVLLDLLGALTGKKYTAEEVPF